MLAAHDRPLLLNDGADGVALVERLLARAVELDRSATTVERLSPTGGDTTYVCAVDADGVGVSLIQSNGAGFGSWLVEPATGIALHNRGIGFSLEPDHPMELRPGRRPPHTLAPALVTRPEGALAAVLGSAGGDAQPQIVVQLLARLLNSGEPVGDAVAAPRWVVRSGPTGFDTWTSLGGETAVVLEEGTPAGWPTGLGRLGHRVEAAGYGAARSDTRRRSPSAPTVPWAPPLSRGAVGRKRPVRPCQRRDVRFAAA